MDSTRDAECDLVRHMVATIAYRAEKVLREVPEGFPTLRSGPTARTPAEILAHMGDLFDWALSIARGAPQWHDSVPQHWGTEVARFFGALQELDDHLRSAGLIRCESRKLLQGPIADALTHVGQLALLRRIAGAPVKGENYFRAEILPGRVGTEQSRVRVEFD
jgi:hypothetical protein